MENTAINVLADNNTEETTMDKVKETAFERYKALLNEYDYDYQEDAIVDTIDVWWKQKEELKKILRKSQYWNEDEQMIVLKNKTILRSFNEQGIVDFENWMLEMFRSKKTEQTVSYYFIEIYEIMRKCFDDNTSNLISISKIKEIIDNPEAADKIINNEVLPLVDGQKWSRYIGNFCKKIGFNTITDVKTEIYSDDEGNAHQRTKDMGYNYHFALLGDSINPLEIKGKTFIISLNFIDYLTMSFGNNWASCHTIDKDNVRCCHGSYEGQWSSGTLSYGLDNVTMISYIVDEENEAVVGRNDHHKYGKDVPYCLRDKEHRCVTSWQNDKLYFGRVYPDGRDGGEKGIAAQFREIIQQVFAECLSASNIWTTKKGVSNTSTYVKGNPDGYTAYDDWNHYEDCSVSFLRKVDGILNEDPIKIAARPMCPCCGDRHRNNENICCPIHDTSGNKEICPRCGCVIDTDNDNYEYINGNYYCSCECAESDGWVWSECYGEWLDEDNAVYCEDNGIYYSDDDDDVVYCQDDCSYHLRENCRQDAYTEDWYSADHEGIETYDDNWYADEENADKAGYILCDDDDEWHHVA